MFSMLSYETLSVVVAVVLGKIIYTAISRLYLSPLASVPGPKLAALTFWYEVYFNVFKPGMFIWEIKRLHEVYGTVQSR